MHIPPNCGVTGFADKFGNALDKNVAIHFLNIPFGHVYLEITECSDEEVEESVNEEESEEEEEGEESEEAVAEESEAVVAVQKAEMKRQALRQIIPGVFIDADIEAGSRLQQIIKKEPEHMMMPAKDSVECSINLTVTGDDISFLSGLNYSIPELMKSLEPKCGLIIPADLGGAQTADVLHRSRVIISKLVWRKLGMGVKVKFMSLADGVTTEFCPDQLREPN